MTIKPQKHKATIKNKDWISARVLKITFETKDTNFKFKAGHFINLKIDEKHYRSYSIGSDPSETGEFDIIVAATHDGIGANFLKEAEVGQEVDFIGPSGRFFLNDPNAKNILFLATGTGLSPFISMLYQLKDQNSKAKIRLRHGVRNQDEMLYKDKLDQFKESLNDFNYTIFLSDPKYDEIPYEKGWVTDKLKIANPSETHVYLCGNPYMVEDAEKMLGKMGFPEENVFYEKFTYAEN